MTVNEIIKKRKSIRSYEKGADLTEEQIKVILEAGMLAPSACNSRPWEFIVVRNREIFELEENIIPFDVIAVGVPNEEFGSRGFYEESKVKWVD